MRQTLVVLACSCVIGGLVAAPADAQYRRRVATSPSVGENYHLEFSTFLWDPTPDMSVSSEELGIVGTTIDAVSDLGMAKAKFKEFRLVLRPAMKHKFRLDYIPISYDGETTLTRDLVFNGQRYTVGLPVNSTLDWKSYDVSYEYDFLYRETWFVGFVLQAKYTDVTVTLKSPVKSLDEYARARAPIPAIGGTFRAYLLPALSVSGEVTGFKLPTSIDKERRYDGKYIDYDFYATYNVTENFGAQVGYRSKHVTYRVEQDTGDFQLKGIYFGGVARF